MATSTRFDDRTVVLTSEGRRRLEARLDASLSDLEDLDRRVATSEQRDEELETRARLVERVRSFRETLQRAVDVDAVEEDPTIIELGDEVEIEHEDGEREHLLLVHPIELDAERGHVPVDSPLGVALLGQRVGDQVEVDSPGGRYRIRVIDRARGH